MMPTDVGVGVGQVLAEGTRATVIAAFDKAVYLRWRWRGGGADDAAGAGRAHPRPVPAAAASRGGGASSASAAARSWPPDGTSS